MYIWSIFFIIGVCCVALSLPWQRVFLWPSCGRPARARALAPQPCAQGRYESTGTPTGVMGMREWQIWIKKRDKSKMKHHRILIFDARMRYSVTIIITNPLRLTWGVSLSGREARVSRPCSADCLPCAGRLGNACEACKGMG